MGHKVRNRHKNRIKRSGQAWLVYVNKKRTATSPPREGEPVGTTAKVNQGETVVKKSQVKVCFAVRVTY